MRGISDIKRVFSHNAKEVSMENRHYYMQILSEIEQRIKNEHLRDDEND